MKDPVDRAIRAIARRHSDALVRAQFGTAQLVTLAGLGLLRLYQPMSLAHAPAVERAAATQTTVESVAD